MRRIDARSGGISFGKSQPTPQDKDVSDEKFFKLKNKISEKARDLEFTRDELKEIFHDCGIKSNMEKEDIVPKLGCVLKTMDEYVEEDFD